MVRFPVCMLVIGNFCSAYLDGPVQDQFDLGCPGRDPGEMEGYRMVEAVIVLAETEGFSGWFRFVE